MPTQIRESSLSGLTNTLFDFLAANLKGSTLKLSSKSNDEILIEADRYIRVLVLIERREKLVSYDVYSPEWKRPIRVEELGGFDYMEAKIEEDLLRLELDRSVQDILIAVDLMRIWSKSNNYKIVETTGPDEAAPPS